MSIIITCISAIAENERIIYNIWGVGKGLGGGGRLLDIVSYALPLGSRFPAILRVSLPNSKSRLLKQTLGRLFRLEQSGL